MNINIRSSSIFINGNLLSIDISRSAYVTLSITVRDFIRERKVD